MATVMKGLRTPWGDGGGGGAWGGRRVSDVAEEEGGKKLKAGEEENIKEACRLFFYAQTNLTMLTHIMPQCRHGNVLSDVMLTLTHHIILYKAFRKSTTQVCLLVYIGLATAS